MTFPESIRIGSKKRPQCFNNFFGVIARAIQRTIQSWGEGQRVCQLDVHEKMGSCVLGASYEGLTGEEGPDDAGHIQNALHDAWPWIDEVRIEHPIHRNAHSAPFGCFADGKGTIWEIAQNLNDEHKWSREKVADWAEKVCPL